MSSPQRRCAKDGCSREATLGSRCALHWLRRQRWFKYIPRTGLDAVWWRRFEPSFAHGIEMRILAINSGYDLQPPLFKLSIKKQECIDVLTKIVETADKVARRQHEERSDRSKAS